MRSIGGNLRTVEGRADAVRRNEGVAPRRRGGGAPAARLALAALFAVGLASCGDSSSSSSQPPLPPSSACGGEGDGRCIVVAPSANDRATILAAFLEAKPGDVIVLTEGRYELDGQVSLDVPNVVVRGEGMDRTILSFKHQMTGGEGILVVADGFTIQDLALEDGPGDMLKVFASDGVTIRRVRVEWTGGPSHRNGAYGIYPVQCKNVLIEDSLAIGASDAGIYVGQSKGIVVRRNRAEYNVAGIEIENSQEADVYDNVATHNTGGILIFNLPGLQVKNGHGTRIHRNQVVDNDTPNFAPPGNIVGSVPDGTGVMIMANDDVETFDNDIAGNQTFGVLIISFNTATLLGGFQANDPLFDPYSEGIYIHDNRYENNGTDPDPETGELVRSILDLPPGSPLPAVVTDGDVDEKKTVDGHLPPALRTCVPEPVPSFGDLDLDGGTVDATTSPAAFQCTLPALPAVDVPGTELGELPADLPPPVTPPANDPTTENRCQVPPGSGVNLNPDDVTCNLLSSYRFFAGDQGDESPNEGVVPFDLNTALFSDYAYKRRFVYVPPGTSAKYRSNLSFDFPVGTAILKTFSYFHDDRDPAAGQKLIETRLLIRLEDRWIGVTYRWNEEQTDATLHVLGDTVPVEWIDEAGQARSVAFRVPDVNQCKECHNEEAKIFGPLGPKARNLNKDYPYPSGVENQLTHWTRVGILEGAPANPNQAPYAPPYDDPAAGSLEERARTYLDVNCSNCHNRQAIARTSGLFLTIDEQNPTALGICKSPVAAGVGTGGRKYDIQPGAPEQSILIYRMESIDPGVAMPELGRQLVHASAIEVLSNWIRGIPGTCE